MDLKEFERQVLAGEITDFEPCFEKLRDGTQMEQRYILAKNGIETDRVSGMDGYSPLVIELIDEACQLLDAAEYEGYHDVLLDVARETGVMSAIVLKDLVVAELMCRM